jgi:hypothetical protein
MKETLIKLIPFMVRQAHHERNQQLTARPELVEGLSQSFLKIVFSKYASKMRCGTIHIFRERGRLVLPVVLLHEPLTNFD